MPSGKTLTLENSVLVRQKISIPFYTQFSKTTRTNITSVIVNDNQWSFMCSLAPSQHQYIIHGIGRIPHKENMESLVRILNIGLLKITIIFSNRDENWFHKKKLDLNFKCL